MPGRWGLGATLLFWSIPSVAFASSRTPDVLDAGAGILGLLAGAVLLAGMLSLSRIARGSAVADNITYGVLAVLCLVASLLVGWVSRWLVVPLSVQTAQLGAELLSVVALVFFTLYFWRVRTAMKHFLSVLTGEAQMLAGAIDAEPDRG